MATLAEAFSSILWAGIVGIWIGGSWLALAVPVMVLAILAFTWWMSPARQKPAFKSALPDRSPR